MTYLNPLNHPKRKEKGTTQGKLDVQLQTIVEATWE